MECGGLPRALRKSLMRNFIQHPKFSYSVEEAEALGRALVGEDGVFEVRRIPGSPIKEPGPEGRLQKVAEYVVFTLSSR